MFLSIERAINNEEVLQSISQIFKGFCLDVSNCINSRQGLTEAEMGQKMSITWLTLRPNETREESVSLTFAKLMRKRPSTSMMRTQEQAFG